MSDKAIPKGKVICQLFSHAALTNIELHPSGLESQPLQQTAAAMTVDFDAVFGSKATPSNNGLQPAAGKAPLCLIVLQTEPD